MVFSVSLVTKTAIMVVLFIGVYLTINQGAELTENTRYYSYLREIAEYVEGMFLDGMNSVSIYRSDSEQVLSLPSIGLEYYVEIYCVNHTDHSEDYVAINVNAPGIKRNYLLQEYMDCSKVAASGRVYEGERCLSIVKTNSTNVINVTLVSNCAA